MGLSNSDIDVLVLATVNAPYAKALDSEALVAAIGDGALARQSAGPLSSFFYDVPPTLQRQFAASHGISEQALARAAARFAQWSGKPWPGAAAA